VSVLLPSTLAVLRTAKTATPPLFSSVMAAELFDAEHTRGHLKILPTTVGGYVIFDATAPLGEGIVAGPLSKLEDTVAVLEQIVQTSQERRKAA
jgi:hypothetical protein